MTSDSACVADALARAATAPDLATIDPMQTLGTGVAEETLARPHLDNLKQAVHTPAAMTRHSLKEAPTGS